MKMGEDCQILDGAQKMREAGYIGYEDGEFVKPTPHHEWLHSPISRFRFCIICGKREHYNINSHKWELLGYFKVVNKEI